MFLRIKEIQSIIQRTSHKPAGPVSVEVAWCRVQSFRKSVNNMEISRQVYYLLVSNGSNVTGLIEQFPQWSGEKMNFKIKPWIP